ncbi:MAG: hypothetical protein E5X48_27520 [Mesorhizobium sp.]|uniref:hypothetical protein n=1 Tax=Mesorhizobium sp. TaxID=1871066 RepID=UPI0012183633|nr:hypothetical protein [Mesorhizobium sp.]TIQ31298.1 MAG: hypothetical protein E5X48_27520 [Mesorhizobium sp.]
MADIAVSAYVCLSRWPALKAGDIQSLFWSLPACNLARIASSSACLFLRLASRGWCYVDEVFIDLGARTTP